MSDTPTPRTDAVRNGSLGLVDYIHFARQLERELSAAKAEIAELRKDKELLDNLERMAFEDKLISIEHIGYYNMTIDGEDFRGDTLREAIDDAVKGGN